MIIDCIILFGAAVGGGLAVRLFSAKERIDIKLPLAFAGSYLFSLTIIHILPELFETNTEGLHIGLFVLAGFFFQHFLEFFTSGVEHGHMHVHPEEHSHGAFSGYTLMLALSIHAFLEGTLLAHPTVLDSGHGSTALLVGVVLHKMPAGLALMSVLTCQYKSRKIHYTLLFLFALASPIGLVLGNYLVPLGWLTSENLVLLFAFVGGNFLHISTTIFIESSPEHNWSLKRLVVIAIAVVLSILAELYA